MDFKTLRKEMVKTQLIPRGIVEKRVLETFSKVPRHVFVPKELRRSAYEDCALPIGEGQTISQPYMVAVMTQLLALKGSEKVLEVGSGSGYQAAILAELTKELITIERNPLLSGKAEKRLKELNCNNVKFTIGDGSQGFKKEAPYQGILVTAACPAVPDPLIDQLAENGRLVLPLGDRFVQKLTVVTKTPEGLRAEASIPCVFVPLIGKYGFK